MTQVESTPVIEKTNEQLHPDQARTIRDFFLASIWVEHNVTRTLIQLVPEDKLDFAAAPGTTISDLMWYLVQAEQYALSGICEGHFSALPPKAEQRGRDAVLAWDAERFPREFERLANLSGEELIRPAVFNGASAPVVTFLPVYMSLLLQHRGQLSLALRICGAGADAVASGLPEDPESAALEDGELTESQLAAAAGGNDGFIQIVVTNGPGPKIPQMSYSTSLGSLFAPVTSDPTTKAIAQGLTAGAFVASTAIIGGVAGLAAASLPGITAAAAWGGAVAAGSAIGGGAAAGAVKGFAGAH